MRYYPLKQIIFLFFTFYYSAFEARSQLLQYPNSIPFSELNVVGKGSMGDFVFFANQASLASLKTSSVGLMNERVFLLENFNKASLGVIYPSLFGNMGLFVNYEGVSGYCHYKIGYAYARRLGEKLDAGIQFNYSNLKVAGYKGISSLYAEGGLLLHIGEGLHAGLHVQNPGAGLFSKSVRERPASVFSLGLLYELSSDFAVSSVILCEEDKDAFLNISFQYCIEKKFFLRGGYYGNTSIAYASVGFFARQIRIDIITGIHPQLGISPGLSIIAFKKNK